MIAAVSSISFASGIVFMVCSMDLRLGGWRRAFEEVEIAAFVGLSDVLLIERAETARESRRRRLPLRAPARELVGGHAQLEPPCMHIELDQIAVAHERERPADEGLRCDVQHAGAVARSAHARDRKSTRLNSSHGSISYAVFCL